MKIYHNPRCTKSRETLALLQDRGIDPEVVLYLVNIPTQKELTALLKLLNLKAEDLVRKNEPIYKEKFKGKHLSDREWIKALVTYPKLIQRPIVVKGNKAIIGRPPEAVLELI